MDPALTRRLRQPGALASELRAARDVLGLSGKQLARKLGWEESKVSRLANARRLPSVEDARQWGVACGLDTARIDHLIELTKEAIALAHAFGSRLPGEEDLADPDKLYHDSSHLVLFSTATLPAVVQTYDYALAAINTAASIGRVEEVGDAETAAQAVIDRQEALQDQAKTWELYVLEQALGQSSANKAGLARSLEQLRHAVELNNVRVGIVPSRPLTKLPQYAPFAMFDRKLVVVEFAHRDIAFLEDGITAVHLRAVQQLEAAALTGPDAIAAIEKAIQAL